MRATILLSLAIAFSLASCANLPKNDTPGKNDSLGYSSDGLVSDRSYIPDDSAHYPELPGVAYLKIEPGPENAMPVYPERLLGKRLPPVVITAKVIVNTAGGVDYAEIEDGDGFDPLFSDATLKAIRTWHFMPLRRVVGGKTEFLPTTEHFLFVFSQVNGKAVVKGGS